MARAKTVRERVEHLLRSDDPAWRMEQLAKIGPDAVFELRGLLSEAVAAHKERRIDRIARLLAFAGGPEDVEVLVDKVLDDEERWTAWAIALATFGERAVEALLAAWENGDAEERKRITITLGGCGVHDPRIAEKLLERLRMGPKAVEMPYVLGQYGDPDLAPTMREVYDAYQVRRDGGVAQGRWIVDLLMAIAELGGDVGEEDLTKVRVSQALLEQAIGDERRGGGDGEADRLGGIADLAMLTRAAKKG